ncbi:MAG: PKD domain-containing protein [Candidatus Thermoplasmatota archaeon]|nr:PKD domain-containing protein [Candidatus Thermoplasmatota archaeon]
MKMESKINIKRETMKENRIGGWKTTLLLTTFLVVGLCFGGVQSLSSYSDVSANPEPAVTIAIMPAEERVPVRATVTVNITIDSAEPLTGVQIDVVFNPDILNATDVINGGMFDTWGPDMGFNWAIDNENGTIKSIVAFNFEGTATNGVFATIKFETIEAGISTINFSNIKLTDASYPPQQVPQEDIAANPGVVSTITILEILPSGQTGSINEDISVDVTLNPAEPIKSLQFDITFNQSIINAVNVSDGGLFDQWDWINKMEIDNNTGTIRNISAINLEDNVTDEPGIFATITFRAIGSGASFVNISNVVIVNSSFEEITPSIINATITIDSEPPTIQDLTSNVATTGDSFTLNADVTDNIEVSAVYVEYWYGTGEHTNVSMEKSGDNYIKVITIDHTLQPLHYIISAVDTSSNWDSTGTKDVTISDNDKPQYTSVAEPTSGTTGESVLVSFTANDNIDVTYYKINVSGTLHDMTKDGDYYNYTIDIPSNSVANIVYNCIFKDAAGNENTTPDRTITVSDNDPPTVAITSGPSGTIDTSTSTFSWSGSDNVGGLQYRYKLTGSWSSWSSAKTKTFGGLSDDSYTFYVEARDGAGNPSSTRTRSFTVDTNEEPVADFSYTPLNPTDLDTITFDASDSDDPDGDIVNYTWDFGDENVSYGKKPTHKYDDNGTYTVTLTVKDDKGATDTCSQAIEIANEPPTAYFTYLPDKPKVNKEITFTDTSTDDDGTITNYTWDFGDGNISYEQNPTHKYDADGTYTATLTITDNDNATDVTSLDIPVEKEPSFILPIIAIIILAIIAIAVVIIWRRRTTKQE